jgi:hypothetical protein
LHVFPYTSMCSFQTASSERFLLQLLFSVSLSSPHALQAPHSTILYVYLITLQIFDAPYYVVDRLCGLVVRVPGYTTEMYCASCEVRTEFIYVM